MAYIAPRIEALPPTQIRHMRASRLSERGAAPRCIGPIHEWDKSDTPMSAEDHTQTGATPTVAAMRAD